MIPNCCLWKVAFLFPELCLQCSGLSSATPLVHFWISRWCSLWPLTSHPKPVNKGAVTSSCFTRPSVRSHHSALIRFIPTVPPVFTCKPLKCSWNDRTLTDHTLSSPIALSWCFSDLLLPEVFEFDIEWIYLGWRRWQHCGFPSDLFVWWMCTTRSKLSKLSRLFNRNNPEDHFLDLYLFLFPWLSMCAQPWYFYSFLSGLWAAMTKSYEFNWQKHLPEFMQEGASFDRFDEVGSSTHRS